MSDNVIKTIFDRLDKGKTCRFKIDILNLAINNYLRDGKLVGDDKKILIEWCEELLKCIKEYDGGEKNDIT